MQRDKSLDALRGIAILTMVLSGSIAFGGALPAWMYHAQVPPPAHVFNATIPGLTWVDLVFPFFLFSMGAAIPLSLQKPEAHSAWKKVLWVAVKRFILLAFFAYFTQHMKAWVLSTTPAAKDHLLSIAAFILLFFQFYDYKGQQHQKLFLIIKSVAFAVAVGLLALLSFSNNTGFDTKRVDIIILVLANMALFGTLIWWATREQPFWRLAVLPLVMAIFLSGKEIGWQKLFYDFSPAPWLYKFYYLKYLFIVIPGTFAGEWLLANADSRDILPSKQELILSACLCALLVVLNTTFLYNRWLLLNLICTVSICAFLFWLLRRQYNVTEKRFLSAGTFLLLLGLCFESYEGGVKKDPSTYSYYFITSGLAFFTLLCLRQVQHLQVCKQAVHYLSLNGRNPMVAYTAGNLLLLPLLHLTGGIDWLNALNTNFATGLLRGLVFTGTVSLITVLFVRRGWFWKT